MPCPYFYPETRCDRFSWNHASRLPLGTGWQGCCRAPAHAGERPGDDDLREHCNLGYAAGCSRMPADAEADAVRFGVFRQQTGMVIKLHFIRERKHLPVDHGTLEFDTEKGIWLVAHPDTVLQRQAECFLEVWRERKR